MASFIYLAILCLALQLTCLNALLTEKSEGENIISEGDDTARPLQNSATGLLPSQTTANTSTTSPQKDNAPQEKPAARKGGSSICQKRGKICVGGLLYYCNKKLRATPRNRRCEQPCYRHFDEYQHGKTYCRGLQSNNGVDCTAQTRGKRPPCICWSCNNSKLKYFYS